MAQRTILSLGQQTATAAEALHPAAPQAGSARSYEVRSLYIHVPFCFHKCHYCDFYSFVDAADQQPAFVAALEVELARLAGHIGRLETIFIGGGTPTLLRVELWEKLLGSLDSRFGIRRLASAGGLEFTVECNPETATPELMRVLARGGVNRLSIGAQSFDAGHLKTLERWHDPANVERALNLAGDAGIARRSIDLIFAVPGQTPAQWEADLERALSLRVGNAPAIEHISCYALTYEPNTPMTHRLNKGEFAAAPENDEVRMFQRTRELLARAGFEAYEISNFARGSGARCRHNLAYWRQEQWLGAGPSASSHYRGWRWKNAPSLGRWMEGVHANQGLSPVLDLEPPDEYRALAEWIMTSLRLSDGVDAEALESRCRAAGRAPAMQRRLELERSRGLLEEVTPGQARAWRLTECGALFADGVAASLMAEVRRQPS